MNFMVLNGRKRHQIIIVVVNEDVYTFINNVRFMSESTWH
jgi:hypothetical protein